MDTFLITIALLLASISAAQNVPRSIVDTVNNTTYDYIVVGCGVAGLVVAMRLSEDPNVSVLCIEAGPLDNYEPQIMFPRWIGSEMGGIYDWNLSTVPQTQLDGRTRGINMGHVVGGGSIINGMIWNRGGIGDFDAWADLGNPGWAWADLLPYFRKSETYTPRYYPDEAAEPPPFDDSIHGSSGPVQVSYPEFFWEQTNNWFEALEVLGIPIAYDANAGLIAGGYYVPNNLDPVNQTRSDARRAYFDPYVSRSNYNILTNSQVTQIIFATNTTSQPSSNTTYQTQRRGIVRPIGHRNPHIHDKRPAGCGMNHAIGVKYASLTGRQTVFASREVIVAAGAIHTPQLLQLSGIGPASLLNSYGIPVLQDLPGVGNNLQDHAMAHLNYSYLNQSYMTPETLKWNTSFEQVAQAQYLANKTGPWTAMASSAIAFPSLPNVANKSCAMIESAINGDRYAPTTYDDTLLAGLERQFQSILTRLALNKTPAFENLNNNAGDLDISLQHPLSRGTVQIGSADPLQSPLVDPRWLVHPFDFQVMVAAMEFNQRILDTSMIRELVPGYNATNYRAPGPNATPEEVIATLKYAIGTEYHYSSTASMLPLEHGGVVDPSLLVYGTDNLRVVDTSIFPLIPAAHLQAVAFAVAEKAADIIKGVNSTTTSSPSSGDLASPTFMCWLLSYLHLNNKGC